MPIRKRPRIDRADQLRNLLHETGLSQSAAAWGIGIHRTSVWRWCNRRACVPSWALIAIRGYAREKQEAEAESSK
jgi:hypothetical protein